MSPFFLRGGGRKKLFYSRLNLLPNPLPLSFLFFAVWLLPTRLLSERQGGAKKETYIRASPVLLQIAFEKGKK